jgi:hypothetical protein
VKTNVRKQVPWRTWLLPLLAGPVALAAGGCGAAPDAASEADFEQAQAAHGATAAGDDSGPAASAGVILPLAAQSVLAFSSPTGLVASTGNLYWTSTSVNEFGPDTSTVWRAGKNNVPGNEVALYRETGDDRFFGDIVFANPGAFFGYFVASYRTASGLISQIKRVPLTGGAAIVIASSPSPGARDLQTDGTRLYWIDAGGIRSVPIGGGPITTLFADSFVGRISLDNSFVYFGEEFLIMRIPKGGGTPQTVVSTNGRVSALYVHAGIGWVFWGEKEGGVRAMPARFGAPVLTFQLPATGREVNSVGWDGLRVLWADCLEPGNTNCRIRDSRAGVTHDLVGGGVGIGHLQWDTASLYWGDTSYLRRFVR